jgi:tetratricopeptide (TPR) repeat protein
VRRVLILAIGMTTTAFAYGQTPGPAAGVPRAYREAVVAYTRGDFDEATDAISAWSPEGLKRIISALIDAQDDWRLAGAAALLHTEFILRGKATTQAAVSLHLTLAQALVDTLRPASAPKQNAPKQNAPRADIPAFQRHWYALAGSVYLASTDPRGARVFIDRGLHLFKNDARLHMLAGAADEMRSHIADGNLHDRAAVHAWALAATRRTHLYAEGSYRRALELDPALEEAHLRLGRVLSLRNELKGARAELEPVARSSAPARIRYLAHLFLGAVAEYQSDLGVARREYSDALSIGPDCQTPYIALTFVEQAMGHDASARELMARYAALSKEATPDPWWDYQNGGIDQESLIWLRQQVMP